MKTLSAIKDLLCMVVGMTIIGWLSIETKVELFRQIQKMLEKIETIFNHWVKEKFKKTACFELKHCKGKSLPFSDVKDHQVAALVAASDKGLVFKIPDLGVQNPFDCFSL
jgi:hypothetical protein